MNDTTVKTNISEVLTEDPISMPDIPEFVT